jgi:chromosome segregation ATPase
MANCHPSRLRTVLMTTNYNENDLQLATLVGGFAEQLNAHKELLNRLDLSLGATVDRMDAALKTFASTCAAHRASNDARMEAVAKLTDDAKESEKTQAKTLRSLRGRVNDLYATLTSINERLARNEQEAKRITWVKGVAILATGLVLGTRFNIEAPLVFRWITDVVSKLFV